MWMMAEDIKLKNEEGPRESIKSPDCSDICSTCTKTSVAWSCLSKLLMDRNGLYSKTDSQFKKLSQSIILCENHGPSKYSQVDLFKILRENVKSKSDLAKLENVFVIVWKYGKNLLPAEKERPRNWRRIKLSNTSFGLVDGIKGGRNLLNKLGYTVEGFDSLEFPDGRSCSDATSRTELSRFLAEIIIAREEISNYLNEIHPDKDFVRKVTELCDRTTSIETEPIYDVPSQVLCAVPDNVQNETKDAAEPLCDICGLEKATLTCQECKAMLLCAGCEQKWHSHQKRTHHTSTPLIKDLHVHPKSGIDLRKEYRPKLPPRQNNLQNQVINVEQDKQTVMPLVTTTEKRSSVTSEMPSKKPTVIPRPRPKSMYAEPSGVGLYADHAKNMVNTLNHPSAKRSPNKTHSEQAKSPKSNYGILPHLSFTHSPSPQFLQANSVRRNLASIMQQSENVEKSTASSGVARRIENFENQKKNEGKQEEPAVLADVSNEFLMPNGHDSKNRSEVTDSRDIEFDTRHDADQYSAEPIYAEIEKPADDRISHDEIPVLQNSDGIFIPEISGETTDLLEKSRCNVEPTAPPLDDVEEENWWSCKHCTFHNQNNTHICDCCAKSSQERLQMYLELAKQNVMNLNHSSPEENNGRTQVSDKVDNYGEANDSTKNGHSLAEVENNGWTQTLKQKVKEFMKKGPVKEKKEKDDLLVQQEKTRGKCEAVTSILKVITYISQPGQYVALY